MSGIRGDPHHEEQIYKYPLEVKGLSPPDTPPTQPEQVHPDHPAIGGVAKDSLKTDFKGEPSVLNAIVSDKSKVPGTDAMKKIFYCFERFILALSTRGTSGMDKALKAEELAYRGDEVPIKEKIKILFEQQKLSEMLDAETKPVKAMYNRLMNFDHPIRLTDGERTELLSYCKALEDKNIASFPPLPSFIQTRLTTPSLLSIEVSIEALKTLKQNCLNAQAEKSPIVLSNLKTSCLPVLKQMRENIDQAYKAADEADRNPLNSYLKRMDSAIENLESFDPKNFTPDQFLDTYHAVSELSGMIGGIKKTINEIPIWQNSVTKSSSSAKELNISKDVGMLSESMEKLGDYYISQEIKNAPKAIKSLFVNFQLITGNQVRIPINNQVAVMNFLKQNPDNVLEFSEFADSLKKMKDNYVLSIINGTYPFKGAEDEQRRLGLYQSKLSCEYAQDTDVTGCCTFLLGMAGTANTQIVTDTLADAIIFARDGTSWKEGPSSRTGKEIKNLNTTAQGLSSAKSEKALEGYAHREGYNSATRFKWEIPSNESFKVKGAISNTFYQKDLTFSPSRELEFTFDYSELFPLLIPGGLPQEDVMNDLFTIQETLRLKNLSRIELGLSSDHKVTDENARAQLRSIPASQRDKISKSQDFWNSIDAGGAVDISDEIRENFTSLLRPIAVLEALFTLQENITAGFLRDDKLDGLQTVGKNLKEILPDGPLRSFILQGEDVNRPLSPKAAERYHLIMAPIVKMAKEVDIEITKAFVFGSEPTIDQPLDFLCRAVDKVADKEKFKELIAKCFDSGIQLSTPLEEMNLDQLAALYNASLEAKDFKIGPKIAGHLEKKINDTLKNSSRKVRKNFKEFEEFTHDSESGKDLLLQYDVLKALNNERGFEALNKSTILTLDELKGCLDDWKTKEKGREQQRLDAESTLANIKETLKFNEQEAAQEAAAAAAAKELADAAKALLLAAPAKKFLKIPINPGDYLKKIGMDIGMDLVTLAEKIPDPDTPLSQMNKEQLFALYHVLEDFASDPLYEKDISILGPEVEGELNKKMDEEFQKNPNKKIQKLFSQHKELLSDNFALKGKLLKELQRGDDETIEAFNKAGIKSQGDIELILPKLYANRFRRNELNIGDYDE